MGTILSLVLAIIRAIPSLKGFFDAFVKGYVNRNVDSMAKEDREALRKAFEEQDQRDLEKAMGNQNAGKEVPATGSEIVDSLPGVRP